MKECIGLLAWLIQKLALISKVESEVLQIFTQLWLIALYRV